MEQNAPVAEASGGSYLFLSQEWIHEVARTIQTTRQTDEQFGKLAEGFSIGLMYVITEPPPILKERYKGSRLTFFVRLEKGVVRKLEIGTEPPLEKKDFTLTSTYEVAKQFYLGERNPANSYISGQLKIEPLSRVYRNPAFTAKAIVTGNMMLKIARQVPTEFTPDGKATAAAAEGQHDTEKAKVQG